jgi:hypothetical protein
MITYRKKKVAMTSLKRHDTKSVFAGAEIAKAIGCIALRVTCITNGETAAIG